MAVAQAPGRAAQTPIGVIYDTQMARPDAALALAALYVFNSKGEARVGAVCVSDSGFNAAVYCDVLSRVYIPNVRNGNQALPVGFAVAAPAPPDPPMVRPAVDRKKDTGDVFYARSIRKVADTGQAEAVLRNGATFNPESVVVLSAPATTLLKALDLGDGKDLFKRRIKRLVIVDPGTPHANAPALRRLVAEWPSPVFLSGREVGESLLFPGADLDKDFAWVPAHPVVDAYRAFKAMPFDAPLHDLAAVHYAVHPDSGFFTTSDAGTVEVSDGGALRFVPGQGNVHRIGVDPAKKAQLLDALVAAATEKVVAGNRGRGGTVPQSSKPVADPV
jgi:hypothetical protein